MIRQSLFLRAKTLYVTLNFTFIGKYWHNVSPTRQGTPSNAFLNDELSTNEAPHNFSHHVASPKFGSVCCMFVFVVNGWKRKGEEDMQRERDAKRLRLTAVYAAASGSQWRNVVYMEARNKTTTKQR